MRIGLLSAWASRAGGGVFEAVVAQAKLIRDLGHQPIVFSLNDRFAESDADRFEGIPVHLHRVRGPAQIGFAPRLLEALVRADLDVLHLHGIWMYPSAAASRWAATTGKPYVISPHGMLDPWILARGKLKKSLARVAYERRSWARASLFHALNQHERIAICRATARHDVRVIPNSVEALEPPPVRSGPPRRFLYLGRIHPKKNIETLLAAWSRFSASVPDAELQIAGWGEPEHVTALKASLAHRAPANVAFIGPAFGEAKAQLLRDAHFLIIPSLSEGLPMAILEAWASGLPVLMSQACNLPEGFLHGAAIDCGTTEGSVLSALRSSLEIGGDPYRRMAAAGYELVRRRFSRAALAGQWGQTYRALVRKNRCIEISESPSAPELRGATQ